MHRRLAPLPRVLALSLLLLVAASEPEASSASPAGAASAPADTVREEAKLIAPSSEAADVFGASVARSGSRIVVGAPEAEGEGRVSVFDLDMGLWSLEATLISSDVQAGDGFGDAVAIDGTTIVVGAPFADPYGTESGAAYVFTWDGMAWTEEARLLAADGASRDRFGRAVAISSGTVVVGAPRDDDQGSSSGSAYVFVREGTVWSQQQKLTAHDGAKDDLLGLAVAADGDTLLLGAPQHDDAASNGGAVYVFVRSDGVWSLQAEVAASDAAAGDRMANAVALDADTLLAGASLSNASGTDSGAAYVFVRSGETWMQQAKLTAVDGEAGQLLGASAGLSGDRVLLGAPEADAGAAHVFERDLGVWTELERVTASDATSGDLYGFALAVDGTGAVVGAPGDDEERGAAYVLSLEALEPIRLVCPPDLETECTSSTDPSVTGRPTFTPDDPAVQITHVDERLAGDCAQAHTILRRWTAASPDGRSDTCTQTIHVVDTTPPSMELVGAAEVVLACGEGEYVEQGVTVEDACDDALPAAAIVGDVVDATVCGTYVVRYEIQDACGNEASLTRTVTVVQPSTLKVSCGVKRRVLWPPFWCLCPVGFEGVVSGAGSAEASTTLRIYSDEPNGWWGTVPDALVCRGRVLLRAQRNRRHDGRVYLLVFEARGGMAGAHVTACTTVVVPRAPTPRSVLDVLEQARAAEAWVLGPDGDGGAPQGFTLLWPREE